MPRQQPHDGSQSFPVNPADYGAHQTYDVEGDNDFDRTFGHGNELTEEELQEIAALGQPQDFIQQDYEQHADQDMGHGFPGPWQDDAGQTTSFLANTGHTSTQTQTCDYRVTGPGTSILYPRSAPHIPVQDPGYVGPRPAAEASNSYHAEDQSQGNDMPSADVPAFVKAGWLPCNLDREDGRPGKCTHWCETRKGLDQHRLRHHNKWREEALKCTLCNDGKVFNALSVLREHLISRKHNFCDYCKSTLPDLVTSAVYQHFQECKDRYNTETLH